MTQEQYDKVYKIQKEIDSLQRNCNQLQKMIGELKENNKYGNIQDIKIQLNGTWVSTSVENIDYGDLFNFLVQQRLKKEEKIDNLKEEFENI